ncbi:MAG: hypothetical protein WBV82_05970 [Myxococcaceae bacterium]
MTKFNHILRFGMLVGLGWAGVQFRLYTEWTDRDGENTGLYSTAATWASWVTSFRVDGWREVDFAILSAREIIPPVS